MTPREENTRRSARRRFEARELINRYKKSHKCIDCGKKYHPCQLDFFRPKEKSEQAIRTYILKPVLISKRLLRSQTVILKDMSECDLVCANCGRLRTYKTQRERRMGPT